MRTDVTVRNRKLSGIKILGRIAFAGDQSPEARKRLFTKLTSTFDPEKKGLGLDLEPFEVVRDMLRDPRHSDTIGGAPQLVKVCQYMQTSPFAVYWPDRKTGKVHLQGRPCLEYERIDRWVLDPDSLESQRAEQPKEDSEDPTKNADG